MSVSVSLSTHVCGCLLRRSLCCEHGVPGCVYSVQCAVLSVSLRRCGFLCVVCGCWWYPKRSVPSRSVLFRSIPVKCNAVDVAVHAVVWWRCCSAYCRWMGAPLENTVKQLLPGGQGTKETTDDVQALFPVIEAIDIGCDGGCFASPLLFVCLCLFVCLRVCHSVSVFFVACLLSPVVHVRIGRPLTALHFPRVGWRTAPAALQLVQVCATPAPPQERTCCCRCRGWGWSWSRSRTRRRRWSRRRRRHRHRHSHHHQHQHAGWRRGPSPNTPFHRAWAGCFAPNGLVFALGAAVR